MIPFKLVFQSNGVKKEVPVRHYSIPRVGEKVIPPGEPMAMTVLTVEYDLEPHDIWVVLS